MSAIPLASLYFIAALAAIGFGIKISRDRSSVARELVGLSQSVALWALFYGIETLSRSAVYRQLWSQFAYIGTYGTGAFLLRFSVRWLRPRQEGWWLQLVWIVPAFMVVAAFTNEWHGLVWPAIGPSEQNPAVWFYDHGPVFWIGIVYEYVVVGASVVLIVIAACTRRGIYRRQALYVVVGVAIAVAGNVVYLTRVIGVPLDTTPIALAVSVAVLRMGVARVRLLDLVPAARSRVVDLVPDGILVLDEEFLIIDWNTAAIRMWNLDRPDLIGTPVAEVIPIWHEQILPMTSANSSGTLRTMLVPMADADTADVMDVDVRRFSLRPRGSSGWIVVFRDASDIRRAERELQQANERLEDLNRILLAQAIHDSLTELFNRAYLDEALPRELARCRRDGTTIALLILDVDRFKSVNDTHGHDAGDRVLKEVAELVRGIVRAGDIPCRYGGDELVAVMPGASEEEAWAIAERIRGRVSAGFFGEGSSRVSVSVSIGVAVFPVHAGSADGLFRAADRALYRAKETGRNQTKCAQPRVS